MLDRTTTSTNGNSQCQLKYLDILRYDCHSLETLETRQLVKNQKERREDKKKINESKRREKGERKGEKKEMSLHRA